ncbi:hypothetical protein [Segniliparus rugosus]|uniref:hypothetical protein n=1 Tax=Segniliparus rugosus TaxID=286804 RepID=UPI0012EBF160|nr:hypothetical protein [Segniliparus rugosus]
MALAGRGKYADATGEVAPLRESRYSAALRSTALSLEASILRQQGCHERALQFDTRALAFLSERAPRQKEDPEFVLARCDALTGVAADNIGLGSLADTRRALDQAETLLDEAESAPFGWRARLRWRWVSAEAAMAEGSPDDALRAAAAGQKLADSCPSRRHACKSRLILAAAHACAASTATARTLAEDVFAKTEDAGLLPLAWAAAMLLHATSPDEGWDGKATALRGQWA